MIPPAELADRPVDLDSEHMNVHPDGQAGKRRILILQGGGLKRILGNKILHKESHCRGTVFLVAQSNN